MGLNFVQHGLLKFFLIKQRGLAGLTTAPICGSAEKPLNLILDWGE